MSSPNLKQTVVALAIVQAFSLPALAQSTAQPLQEVVVTGSKLAPATHAGVAGFAAMPLMKTPATVTALGQEQLQDLSIRNTTEAMRFDASVSESYNAVGYAEMFSIRGFKLENASSYRKDGIAIAGDAQIPLENKEQIEILKGLAGLTAGVASPGGIVNYTTKRPTNVPLRSVTIEARERGTVYGAIDLGGRMSDKRFGYRINAAAEKLRSYVKGANGEREFISAAFDWQLSDKALLQLDLDHQHKAQITAPGYQLVRGVELPKNPSPTMLFNDQPWTKPVDTRSSNIGLRFEYAIDDNWRATLSTNKHNFRRDDYAAFPYGCSNEPDVYYEGTCTNGDYDLYDYQSPDERKNPFGAQALLQGKFATGSVKHDLTLGASILKRSDYFGDYVYAYVGYTNVYNNLIVLPSTDPTGPVSERRKDNERAFFAQDVITLSPQFQVHAGLRHVQVKRVAAGVDKGSWNFVLPSVALVYNPNSDWMTYASVSHGLQHGGTADLGTSNEEDVLAPGRSKQLEFGLKGAVNETMTVTAALFQITQGLEYENGDVPKPTFVRNGEEMHRGLELGVQGHVNSDLKYNVSLMAIKMRQEGTGSDEYDGKRPPNVAPFKSTSVLEYKLRSVPALKLTGIWQYSGKKAFDNRNTVFVPGYHLFGVGTTYATRIGGINTTIRANIDNLADKVYWRDVSPLLGGYLLPGAPRTARVSAQFDF